MAAALPPEPTPVLPAPAPAATTPRWRRVALMLLAYALVLGVGFAIGFTTTLPGRPSTARQGHAPARHLGAPVTPSPG